MDMASANGSTWREVYGAGFVTHWSIDESQAPPPSTHRSSRPVTFFLVV